MLIPFLFFTGALVGAGIVAGAGNVNFGALGRDFVMPLLFSPVLAVVAGGGLYCICRGLRLAFGIHKDRITDMNPGQGFAANLVTAILVNTASYPGLHVSTTHVSVGSLLGIGITTRQAKWKQVFGVLLSWVVTLPCAATLSALCYRLLRPD